MRRFAFRVLLAISVVLVTLAAFASVAFADTVGPGV